VLEWNDEYWRWDLETLEWQNDWSVGNETLDADHRRLIGIINQVNAYETYDVDIARLLDELKEYARLHFAIEEELMAAAGFDGLGSHRAEHQDFVNWLEALQLTFSHAQFSRSTILDRVNEYLRAWLLKHILETDKKYVGHI